MGRDVTAGLTLIVAGAGFAAMAVIRLPLGSVRHMGPGLFPLALGALLALLGLAVALPALRQDQPMPRLKLRPLMAVLAAVAGFALAIRPLGLVAAVLIVVAVAAAAIPGQSWRVVAALALGMAALAAAIFAGLLGLDLPLWPAALTGGA